MRAQRFDGSLEFLLIDGGSTDGTRETLSRIASEDPRVRVLDNPTGGSTPTSLNIGLRHARGTWVARMDAHTEYSDDYLALGVQRLERGGTSWVSGPMVPIGTNPVSRAVMLAMRTFVGRGATRKWAVDGERANEEYTLDSGVFCGVWSREMLLEIGGWDERWLRNQDSEMAGRFMARGETLVCLPAMAAAYTPRQTLKALWRQYRQYGQYRERTAVRHPNTLRRSHILLPGLVLTAAGAIVAPKPLRTLARAAIGSYLALLATVGLATADQTESLYEAALVPVVIAVMHFGHGVGFLIGVRHNGPPTAALAGFAGVGVDERATLSEPVHAPSLAADPAP